MIYLICHSLEYTLFSSLHSTIDMDEHVIGCERERRKIVEHMDIVNQSNESTVSTLSFSSVKNSINDEKVVKKEIESSSIVPKLIRGNMTSDSYHHSSKKCGFKEILRPKSWPNPFVQGRYEIINSMKS